MPAVKAAEPFPLVIKKDEFHTYGACVKTYISHHLGFPNINVNKLYHRIFIPFDPFLSVFLPFLMKEVSRTGIDHSQELVDKIWHHTGHFPVHPDLFP